MAGAVLYEHANFGGNSRSFYNNDPNARYAIGYYDPVFRNFGVRHSRRFNDYASSVKLYGTGNPQRNTFVAFENAGFFGKALAYSYSSYRGIPYFGNWFNDTASSAIIVKHPNTTPQRPLRVISFQALATVGNMTQQINNTLASNATNPVTSIALRNEPLKFQFTIDRNPWAGYPLVMWTWPVHLKINGYPDDDVDVIYWLYFYGDSSGSIKVQVVDSILANQNAIFNGNPFVNIFAPGYAWLGSIIGKRIRDAFKGARQTVEDSFQAGLNTLLRIYGNPKIQYTYIMPGTALFDANQPQDYSTQDTNYDSTLVLAPFQ